MASRDDTRVLARAVSLNVVGQFGGFLVALATAILLARLLGPSGRGLLAIMVAVASVALAVTSAGIQTASQYFASRRETSQSAVLGNNLAYCAILAVVFVPMFLLLHRPLAALFASGRGGLVWGLAALLVPLMFLDYASAGHLCGRLQFGLWNVLLLASRVASLVGVAVLVGLAGLGVAGAVIATAMGSLVIGLIATLRLLREGRPRLDVALFRRSAVYGLKAQVGAVFQLLNFRLDLILLGLLVPLAAVGRYAVAQTLAELVIYLGAAFHNGVLPLLARSPELKRQAETSRFAVRHHGVLALGLVGANAIFAPIVLLLGYGSAFRPALIPLLILLPGMWFAGTGSLVMGDLHGRGKPGLASWIKGAAAALTVALDLVLIPRYGINGAAVASLIAYTFFGCASLVVLARVSGVAVRELVVPSRQDLALYPQVARAVLARVRRRRPSADALAAGRA